MKLDGTFARAGFVDPFWVTVGVWSFVLLGAAAADLNPLSVEFVAFVFVGVGAHLAGMGLCLRQARRRNPTISAKPPLPSEESRRQGQRSLRKATRTTYVLLAILLAALIFFIRAYMEVVPSLDAIGFIAARNAYLEEARGLRDKFFLYTTHATLLGLAAMFFAAKAYRQAGSLGICASRVPATVLAITVFSLALLTTGRTAPLLVIISYSFYSLRFGLFKPQTVVVAFGCLSLTMFVVVAFAFGKEGLGTSDQISIGESLANLGRIYFFSAPLAMQEVVLRNEVVSNVCSNIFSYPLDLLKKVGFFQQCEARELDFVFVPVATNVFTFLRAYWEDFSWGYPIALFLSGYLIEYIYLRAIRRIGFSTFLFPFILNGVLLQIFEEQIFANGSVFAYLLVSFLICDWLYRIPRPRKRQTSSYIPLTGSESPTLG
ncbi:MAG: O-antigen polymerase [Rubrivivax sp.]|nr:O-antigen polymerase [Rubrivivax sp.]